MKYRFTDIIEFVDYPCKEFEGERKYISTGAVHEDKIDDKEIITINYRTKPSRANLEVKPGTILFAKMQNTQKTLYINEEMSDSIYSTGFFAIKPRTSIVNEKILFYIINNDIFLKEKDKNCSGATQKAINKQGLKKIELNIPPIDIQYNIEKILENLSSIIFSEKIQLKKLDLLVKARFVEMFGDPTTNNKGWDTESLSDVAPISSPILPKINNIWLLNLDMVESQSGTIIKKEYIDSEIINASTCSFDNKNVLYSKLRPYLNKVVLPDQEGYCTSELIPLKPTYKLTREFLASLLRSKFFVNYISEKVAGAKMPRVSMKTFKEFQCILPPISKQKEFTKLFHQVDKSKFAIQKSLKKTQMLYDSLMQEYFG